MLTRGEVRGTFDHYLRFLALTQSEDLVQPKRHAVLHVLRRSAYLGNPRVYANWWDETLNRLLKRCCRQVSQQTFEASVLFNVNQLLAKRGVKRTRG